MKTNRVAPTNTQRHRSRWTPLWILCFAVASIPLALVMEGLMGMNSPGFVILPDLSSGHDPHDISRLLVTGVVVDSAFCFVVLLGLYLLFTRPKLICRNVPITFKSLRQGF